MKTKLRNSNKTGAMNAEQAKAVAAIQKGDSIFITGAGGVGKSFVVDEVRKLLRKNRKNFHVCASTGIAAVNVGGTTAHSFFGLTPFNRTLEDFLKMSKGKAPQQPGGPVTDSKFTKIKNLDVLLIDEISMIAGPLLDLMSDICKHLRGSEMPFGGIQVVIFGDFYQLGPIEEIYAFESKSWKELNPQTIELQQIMRQKDKAFAEQLCKLRKGYVDEEVISMLKIISSPPADRLPKPEMSPHVQAVKLESLNVDKDRINEAAHEAQSGVEFCYMATKKGDVKLLRGCLAPDILKLKPGSPVLHLVNNSDLGLYNGSVGVVVDPAPYSETGTREGPLVRFWDEQEESFFELRILQNGWKIEVGGRTVATKTQYPLTLAYCVSMHKSQGQSLDCVHVNLEKWFACGQCYVAISRARTMAGLYLKGVKDLTVGAIEKMFLPHQKVAAFYDQ